jgi:hypothetical protein
VPSVPRGRQLVTPRDAANYFMALPTAEQNLEERQTAISCLKRRLIESSNLPPIEQDDLSSNRHPALICCLSMIFSENRFPLFRIML